MSNQPRHDLLFAAKAVDPARPPRVDLHMHTDWTDGADSAAAMHAAAVSRGLEIILFSEHARVTSTDWFPEFARQVEGLDASQTKAMVGVEVKITDFEGGLDLAPEIASDCEMVMASVHRFPGEAGQIKGTTGGYTKDEAVRIEYELSCAAIENPSTTILGHPFGMSISRFKADPPVHLFRDLIRRCTAAGVGFEINSRYHAAPRELLAMCQEEDGLISLGSNAHAVAEVGTINAQLMGAA